MEAQSKERPLEEYKEDVVSNAQLEKQEHTVARLNSSPHHPVTEQGKGRMV